jgi:pyruvate ferredoxin oxidoreductase delta subunit
MSEKPGWKKIPPAGLIVRAGNAREYKTGDWRTQKPIIDQDLCTDCLTCWVNCPDSSIVVEDGKFKEFDYDHCKGCAICVGVCPKKAISMESER